MLVPALLLTAVLLLAAKLLGRAMKLAREDRTAIMFEFPCQNLAVVALVGVSVLERPDLVVFAVACFVVQAAALLVVARITAYRASRSAGG